jgi:hypothetical protein
VNDLVAQVQGISGVQPGVVKQIKRLLADHATALGLVFKDGQYIVGNAA